jgi:hypothetical protein
MDTTTKQAPLEGELVDPEETAIARQEGGSLSTEGLAFRADGVQALERAIELLKRGRKAMLGLTDPADWVAQKTMPPTAMLCNSGALKIAPLLGIQLEPVPSATDLTPAEETIDGKRAYTVRALYSSRLLGICKQEIEATRREDEDFTGRMLDGERNFTRKSESKASGYDGDLRNATRTLLLTKAVRKCGFSKVPIADLEEAWQGSRKKADQLQGGHGFGSSRGNPLGGRMDIEQIRDQISCLTGDAYLGEADRLLRENGYAYDPDSRCTCDDEGEYGHDFACGFAPAPERS